MGKIDIATVYADDVRIIINEKCGHGRTGIIRVGIIDDFHSIISSG